MEVEDNDDYDPLYIPLAEDEDEDERNDVNLRSTPAIGIKKLLREDLVENEAMIARLRQVAEIVTTS